MVQEPIVMGTIQEEDIALEKIGEATQKALPLQNRIKLQNI